MISERTKKALDEKLLRIGQWRKGANSFLKPEVSAKAAQSNRNRAVSNENNRKASELISALLEAKVSYVEMARRLNRAGFKTAKGSSFQATQVMRLANKQAKS
jgi:hypothetical protein